MTHQINPLPFLILAFMGVLGYVLGGFSAALIFLTVWLGVMIAAQIFSR